MDIEDTNLLKGNNDALRGLNMEEVLKEIVEQLKLIRISISGIGFTLLLMLFFKNMHGK